MINFLHHTNQQISENEKETKHFKIQYIFPQRLTTEGEAETEPEGAGELEGAGEAETEEVMGTVEMVSFFKKLKNNLNRKKLNHRKPLQF